MIGIDTLNAGRDYVVSPTGLRYAVADVTDDGYGVWLVRVDEYDMPVGPRRRRLTDATAEGWTREARAIPNGTYRPHAPGARTIAEARELSVDGEPVSAQVTDGFASVFVGTALVFEGELPLTVRDTSQLFAWIVRTAGYTAETAGAQTPAPVESAPAVCAAFTGTYSPAAFDAPESGVTGCACCGQATMASDIRAASYCDDCAAHGGEDCPGSGSGVIFDSAWHCPTGVCDGSGCAGTEHADDGLGDLRALLTF